MAPYDAAMARALVRRETIASVPIGAAMSIAIFLFAFGWQPVARLPLAVDFIPQTIGMGVLGTLVPTLLTLRKLRRGQASSAGPVPSWFAQMRFSMVVIGSATLVFGGSAALLLGTLGPGIIPPAPALAIKALYGAAAGAVMTKLVLQSLLGLRGAGANAVRT